MVLLTKFAIAALNARKIFGYTPGEVSEAVSISARWYQKSESGKRLSGSVTLIRIILFLRIYVEDLREEAELFVPVHSI
ncbi:MAG: helix-turn-helix transcriptional regulator [Oscillospiraceae bacterium]|nr:helix-turn-helix transcriptional regulator [Oscillospiraceae bacterium]